MSESKDLQVIVSESGLDAAKAQFLLDNFTEYFKLAAEWEVKAKSLVVTSDAQVAEMKMAREGRLFLREKRIAVENARKKLKEQALREGKAIDGIANILKALIVPIEEYLDKQEHYTEYRIAAEEEARRVAAEQALREKEEADRIAREAEEKRIREENERLRKEAEAREAAIAKEREAAARKQAKERAAAEKKLADERKAADAQIAKERAEAEARLAEERKKAAEAAAKAQKEAEAKAAKERTEYEAKIAEERRIAAMITCPKCGHRFTKEA